MTMPAAARLFDLRWGLVAVLLLLAAQAGLRGWLMTAPAPEAIGLDQIAAFNQGQLCSFDGGDPHPQHQSVSHEHCLVCFVHLVAAMPSGHRPVGFAQVSSAAPVAYALVASPRPAPHNAPRAPPAPA
ncbi:MAG: hypothetical protein SFU83_25025 [Meiothermus sp.]|nr:hypothetical protein [Meiothermus sp.]